MIEHRPLLARAQRQHHVDPAQRRGRMAHRSADVLCFQPPGTYLERILCRHAGSDVTTTDGTKYYFGSTQYDGNGSPIGNWTETYLDNEYISSAWKTRRQGLRWYLRRVEDVRGNAMTYEYDRENDNWLPGSCLDSGDVEYWYTHATYLRKVQWSANAVSAATLQLDLIREP